MIPTICINSRNRPQEVPQNEWITKGMQYNITHVFYHPEQGIQGCALKEVRLTYKSSPYETYALNRFAVTQEGLKDLIEMMKLCSELNEVDIMKLIEESELQTVEK